MSHEAHEPRSTRDARPWGASLWSLASPVPDTEDLDVHLAWLAQRVGGKSDDLAQLHDEKYQLDWFCFVEVLYGQGGVSIRPEVMTALGVLPVKLALDIYASHDED